MDIPDFNSISIKDYKPAKHYLSNQIPVYCFEDKDMEVVFLKIVFYNAGTIMQDKFFTASLTKTQLAQDTRDYTALELADKMDYYGINFSHSASNERTVLNFSFLKRYVQQAFELIEQIVLYPLFSADKLSLTVDNARQEFQTKCMQSSFIAHRQFMKALFGEDNPYGQSAELEDYDRITAEDLKQFYKKYYTFNQCYVILAGNAGKDTLETAVLTHPVIQIDTSAKHHRIISDAKDAVQSSIVIGRLLPAIKHDDFIPLTVLNCLLGGYFNSRLMTNIREDKGYTYGIDSYIAPFSKASVFMIASDVTADKDNLTIEEIKKEIEILQTESVSTEELDTVKHYIIGDMLRSNDGVYDISETYDQMIRFDLPDNYNSWSMQKVKQVSQKDITDTAKKYLNTEQMVVSVAKNMNK